MISEFLESLYIFMNSEEIHLLESSLALLATPSIIDMK